VIPEAVELSVLTGIGGWECPSSTRVVRSATASWQLTKRSPTSASAAEAMTWCSLWQMVWMGPFGA
jgi:hypothetical protein